MLQPSTTNVLTCHVVLSSTTPTTRAFNLGQISYDCAAEKRSRRLARSSAARGCVSIMQRVGCRQRFLCRGRNTDAGRWLNRCSANTAQLLAVNKNKVGRLQTNLQENLQTAIAPACHVAGGLWRWAADTRSACGQDREPCWLDVDPLRVSAAPAIGKTELRATDGAPASPVRSGSIPEPVDRPILPSLGHLPHAASDCSRSLARRRWQKAGYVRSCLAGRPQRHQT